MKVKELIEKLEQLDPEMDHLSQLYDDFQKAVIINHY